MTKNVNWEDLTEAQKEHATDQYIYMRACEEELTEEEYVFDILGKHIPISDMAENKECQELASYYSYEIDTEDEDFLYVNL